MGSVPVILADILEPGRGRVEIADLFAAYAAACAAQGRRPIPADEFPAELAALCEQLGIKIEGSSSGVPVRLAYCLAGARVNRYLGRQMITATQCKMARAAVGWGVRDLAEKAGISPNTVARFENDKNKFEANLATLKLIRLAFEQAGIRFTDDGGIVPPKKE